MKKDMDVFRAQEEFSRVFSLRIIGPHIPLSGSRDEIRKQIETKMRDMTAAYIALTEFVKKDELNFIKNKN